MPSERSVSVPLICPPSKLDAVLATPALPCHLLHATSSEEPVQGKDAERDGPKEGAGEEPQQIRFIGRGGSQDPNHKWGASTRQNRPDRKRRPMQTSSGEQTVQT